MWGKTQVDKHRTWCQQGIKHTPRTHYIQKCRWSLLKSRVGVFLIQTLPRRHKVQILLKPQVTICFAVQNGSLFRVMLLIIMLALKVYSNAIPCTSSHPVRSQRLCSSHTSRSYKRGNRLPTQSVPSEAAKVWGCWRGLLKGWQYVTGRPSTRIRMSCFQFRAVLACHRSAQCCALFKAWSQLWQLPVSPDHVFQGYTPKSQQQ